MKLKLLRKDPCSKCGTPEVREEYEIVRDKGDNGTLSYRYLTKEKCECGRNYERLSP